MTRLIATRPLQAGGLALLLVTLATASADAQRRDGFEAQRKRLVEENVAGAGVKDPRVLQSLLDTPRHEFVAPALRDQAYYDMALPIGSQQTISSPFIVAYMTECLDPQPTDKVLEIGTGSGYQAAVLSPLVQDVYTIEIVPALGRAAERVLRKLNYKNVHTKVGDGFKGWPEHAPFDKVIVTCSPEKVPQPLVDQLAEGGLMVIPVGERYQQTLFLMRKRDGRLQSEALRPTLFVPMTGTAEQRRVEQPDPLNPQIANGGFEETLDERDDVSPGWYYQRQMTVVADDDAPQGQRYIRFQNQDAGRAAHLLQGLAIDGRQVKAVQLSCRVRTTNVREASFGREYCTVAMTFYDENRKDLGSFTLGAFRGTEAWRLVGKQLRVPPQAREAIVRVGLFGATGEACFDDFRLSAVR